MQGLKNELRRELTENILPFWMEKMPDKEYGGFYGRIDGQGHLHKTANKGLVLNARILWTFSAAYRLEKNPHYREMAERAYRYLSEHFIDKKNGGVYWELDHRGNPVNTRKQIYAQGFALYGLSEFYCATGESEALDEAVNLFHLIEKFALDTRHGGYIEALNEDWQAIDDMRLSPRDANAPKSMNTHLHILEPYTNLLRVWKDPGLLTAQTRLLETFCKFIVNPESKHLNLFFDWDWTSLSRIISYGHDIESAWLLLEAAEVVRDPELTAKVKKLSIDLVEAAYEGLQPDGSMIYEITNEGYTDTDRHWWVQAETVIGSFHACLISGDKKYMDVATKCWEYIKAFLLDKVSGEWVWSVHADGSQNHTDDKAGFWKCPYHNARMCMGIIDN
jgi:mannobiose 2-epimerase